MLLLLLFLNYFFKNILISFLLFHWLLFRLFQVSFLRQFNHFRLRSYCIIIRVIIIWLFFFRLKDFSRVKNFRFFKFKTPCSLGQVIVIKILLAILFWRMKNRSFCIFKICCFPFMWFVGRSSSNTLRMGHSKRFSICQIILLDFEITYFFIFNH